MSQIEYSQTLGQHEEIEHLLTRKSYLNWLCGTSSNVLVDALMYNAIIKHMYLKQHGLPLDSEIKGL